MIALLFYIGLIIIIGYYTSKKLFSAPSDFDNVPSIPTLKFLWALIRKRPQDEIQEIISQVPNEGLLKAGTGTISFFYFQDVEYIKQFLTKSEDVLPKIEHKLGNRVKSFYGNGILFSNGNTWRIQRKLANAGFNRALSHDVIGENAFKLFNLMDYNLFNPINIYEMMQRLTIEILGQVSFAYDFGGLNSIETPDIIRTFKYLMKQTENELYIYFSILDKLPLKSNRIYREKMNEFNKFLLNIIEQRKKDLFKLNYQDKVKSEDENKDILMSMLEMSEKEGIMIDSHELRDNLVNFLLAGHDTTSLNMSVSIYHLAKYQEMQKKAREEVIRVLGNELKIPTSEQVKELKYVNAIIKESLRTYPPLATSIPRQPNDYVQIGPYLIPPNSYNCVNTWYVHHDPKHWKNPNQYDPERFFNDEKRHPYSWIPFSGGPRNCAGQNFSLMEQRVLMAMILLKYEWTLPEDSIHKNKFYLDSHFLLKPRDLSVEIQFKRRL